MAKAMAVVGKIVETAPIDGADRIKQAVVFCGDSGKWTGVVGKDIEIGQMVTVFLQDALLPPSDRWSFMEKHQWRVRMTRFKGVPSECLIISGAPEMPLGTDLTESLGVAKYEKPIPSGMSGDVVGAFPSFIPKTDELNFQAVENWPELLSSGGWSATEKADGTSCTAWTDDDGLHVCSRNWELKEFTASGAKNVYWIVARKYGLDRLPHGMALQFEVVGPGIQGNPMGLAELESRAFSLYNIVTNRYEPASELQSICRVLDIKMAVQLPIDTRAYTADELRKLAEIRYQNGKHGEGIVIKANDSSWSFKVINLAYVEK